MTGWMNGDKSSLQPEMVSLVTFRYYLKKSFTSLDYLYNSADIILKVINT